MKSFSLNFIKNIYNFDKTVIFNSIIQNWFTASYLRNGLDTLSLNFFFLIWYSYETFALKMCLQS